MASESHDSDTSSSFSSGDEGEDFNTNIEYGTNAQVSIETLEDEFIGRDNKINKSVVQGASSIPTELVDMVHALLEGKLSYDYDAYMNALYHLRSRWPSEDVADESLINEFKGLRANLYARFHLAFPLTKDMYAEWIDDVSSLEEQQKLFESAAEDYASVSLTLGYLNFLNENAEDLGIGRKDIEYAMLKAQQSVGYHYTEGHEIWQLSRQIVSQWYDEGKSSKENALAKENAIRDLFCRQLEIPLQQNDIVMSEFRSWHAYNTNEKKEIREKRFDEVYELHTKSFASLYKKMDSYEERLQKGFSSEAEETTEQVWLKYINLIKYKVSPLLADKQKQVDLITSTFERAISMVCLSVNLWTNYFAHAQEHNPTHKLDVLLRAVRNVFFDSSFWVELLLEIESRGNSFAEVKKIAQELFAREPLCMDEYHYLNVALTFCDASRRHHMSKKMDTFSYNQLKKSFELCEAFFETHFPVSNVGLTQLLQYHAKVEAIHVSNISIWLSIWSRIVSLRGAEAEVWLAYYQESRRVQVPIAEIRQLLHNAHFTVSDYPESILDTWLAFERECGDFDTYLFVRNLHKQSTLEASQKRMTTSMKHDDQGPKAENKKSGRTKRAADDSNYDDRPSQRRKQEQNNVLQEKRKEMHLNHSNENTLFLCNLSKEVMKSDLEELFQGVNGLKDVRLVVKNRVSQASRGMAYVEFETVEGMNEGLNFNGKIFRGHPLNIQKSQPRIKSSESAHTKEAARDGSWKTNPYTVYLGGIQNDTTTEKLINTFTEIIGGVEDVFIPQAKRNKPKNYALIQFASEKDVTKLVESSGPDSILQLLKQKLDNNKLTVRRSRFDIEEFRREQETQRLKHNKVDASNQSRKRATPLPGKLIPHSKPATRLSILSFVPTTVKKKANSTNPTTKQSKAPEKDDTKLNISSISSSNAGSKTQDDFRKLFVNN